MKGHIVASLLLVLLLTAAFPASAQNPNLPSVTSVSLDKSMLVGGGFVPSDRCVGTVTISQPHGHDIGFGLLAHDRDAMRVVAQRAQTGDVIGMQMCIDSLHQFQVKLFDEMKIAINFLEDRIDDQRFAALSAGKQIRIGA